MALGCQESGLVVLGSGMIMPEPTRAIINEEFGAEVFDKHGAGEFSGIDYDGALG